jgi:hypothetical protein
MRALKQQKEERDHASVVCVRYRRHVYAGQDGSCG